MLMVGWVMFLSLQIAFGVPEVNKVEANSNTAEVNGGIFKM